MKHPQPVVVSVSEERTVIDKAKVSLGSFIQMSLEDFQRLTSALGVEEHTVEMKGRFRGRKAQVFNIRNAEDTAVMTFRHYVVSGNGESAARGRLEASWNPQTWFSGQNASPVVCRRTGGMLMPPSASVVYPYRLLIELLGDALAEAERASVRDTVASVIGAVSKGIEGACYSRLDISLYSPVVDTGPLRALIRCCAAVYGWSIGLNVPEKIGRKSTAVLSLKEETGVEFTAYSGKLEYTGDAHPTGFVLRSRTMSLSCYRKSDELRAKAERSGTPTSHVEGTDTRLRMEAVLTGDALVSSKPLRELLRVPEKQGKAWYGTVECLKVMEKNCGEELECLLREVMSLYARRLGLALFINAKPRGGWVELIEKRVKQAFVGLDKEERDEVKTAVSWLLERWEARWGRKKLAAAQYRKNPGMMRRIHEIQVECCGWSVRDFSSGSIDLIYHAMAASTLSRIEHLRMIRFKNDGNREEAAKLEDASYARVKQLATATRKLRLR